jgi:hypothetical protein
MSSEIISLSFEESQSRTQSEKGKYEIFVVTGYLWGQDGPIGVNYQADYLPPIRFTVDDSPSIPEGARKAIEAGYKAAIDENDCWVFFRETKISLEENGDQ